MRHNEKAVCLEQTAGGGRNNTASVSSMIAQPPPAVNTLDEAARLFAQAEAAKPFDYQQYWTLRRQALLAQAAAVMGTVPL